MDKEDNIGTMIADGLGLPAPATPAVPETPAIPAETPVAAAPAEVPPATPPAAPAAEPVRTQESVPLPTFLDMRDENKRLKAELAKRDEAKPAAPATPAPSFKDDPDGFAAHLAEQTTRTAIGTRFEVSELTAREKHGDDVVTKAMDWGMQRSQDSPAFAAEYLKQPNPIAWAVKQHKQSQLMAEVGDDPDAFVRKRAAELGLVEKAAAPPQAAVPAIPQPASPAAPTRSLASAPSAGGPAAVPAGDFAAFDAINPGR